MGPLRFEIRGKVGERVAACKPAASLDTGRPIRFALAMAPSRELLEILVCPESREPLLYFPDGDPRDGGEPFLFCPASRLLYRIDDDVPVMLVEEAVRVSEAEAERLTGAGANTTAAAD
jgi:uncharacterized protein